MECKLCSRRFSNGKALGGHMRSHFATLPLPPKTPELSEPLTDSTSSSGEKSSLLTGSYGLREKKRKRSSRLADPDPESESESTRLRRKRTKGMSAEEDDQEVEVDTKGFSSEMSELEMEEDVALCLVMLSKDVWSSDELTRLGMSQAVTKVYKCEKCDRIFKSSQGLGSHRSNHHQKKIKDLFENELRKPEITAGKEQEVCECVICGRIFKSAQALGGHKRSHLLVAKIGHAAIDLNVPAEIVDEEFDSFLC